MAVDAELAAIIGGSIAGVVVLVAIIAVLVCICCGKRRRKKRREQKKFQQLTPHTSPSHSQPSSLGHEAPLPPPDPRLPKVGSNGLWLGTPGIYAATPSPAYYYSRPGGKAPHANHPHHLHPNHHGMQRASSESRLPHREDHFKYRPPERRAASLQRVPGGPGIYAIGGNQQRIYHSQQMAALTPLYEVVDPRNGSVYDVYQIGEGSKTKLLQDNRGRSNDRPSKSSKKVQRSQSDVVQDAAKRPHRHKPPHDGHRSSKNASASRETAQVHVPKGSTAAVGQAAAAGVINSGFVGSSEKISEEGKATTVAASATDSMKLLAKNRTDDEKKVVTSSASSDSEGKDPSPPPIPVPAPDPSLHYTYGGDIYAVPDKEENRRRSRAENPILARMQDMILDRADTLDPGQVTDVTQTAEPLVIGPTYADPSQGASLIQNPLYQEGEEGASESPAVDRLDLARTQGLDSGNEVVAAAAHTAADELDSGARGVGGSAHAVTVDDVAASSAVTSLRDAGERGVGGQHEEGTTVVKEVLDTKWSVDTDATTDEISRAGKHISVTAEAFEFLDKYLSDEDGVEAHSSPNSPVLSGHDEMMY